MQLRNQVEWAVHVVAALAGLDAGERLSAAALAELFEVPPKYLAKALQALARAGLIASSPGPQGGYALDRGAADISMLQILDAVEAPAPMFRCEQIRRNGPCRRFAKKEFSPQCQVAAVFARAERAYRAELSRVSVADLTQVVRREVSPEILTTIQSWIDRHTSGGV